MQNLRNAMHVSIGLPSPKWLLKLGALFIKTETELVLKSCWVLAEKLLQEGYRFRYDTIEKALDDLLK